MSIIIDRTKTIDHISFSSQNEWRNCRYYFYLKRFLQIKFNENSVETFHGKIIHEGVQNILSGKLTAEQQIKKYERTWKKFCGLYKDYVQDKNLQDLSFCAQRIFLLIEKKFREQFKDGFTVLSVEQFIDRPFKQFSQHFVGYIDLVVLTPDGKVFIIDFKTCKSKFFWKKYEDCHKDYQLTLYKKFFSEMTDTPLDKIETEFVLLEMDSKSKDPIEFVHVTSGNKKIKNAEIELEKTLEQINKLEVFCNYSHCYSYGKKCVYRFKYCKVQK